MEMERMARELYAIMERMPRQAPHRALLELSKGELFMLRHLLRRGAPTSPGELSRAMDSSTARVAAALNSMERKGWVVRTREEADKRRTRVSITPEGARVAEACQRRMTEGLRGLLDALGGHDAAEYLRIMRRIEGLAGHLREDVPSEKEENRTK